MSEWSSKETVNCNDDRPLCRMYRTMLRRTCQDITKTLWQTDVQGARPSPRTVKGPDNPTCQLLPIRVAKKGEGGMGKAGKRQEMVEDRSSERVPCEKVVCVSKLCVRKCV